MDGMVDGNDPFIWTAKRERAALLLARADGSTRDIAAACSLSYASLAALRANPAFDARVREYSTASQRAELASGPAAVASRLTALTARYTEFERSVALRAVDPTLLAPGVETGLLCRAPGRARALYSVDAPLVRAMLESLRDAAALAGASASGGATINGTNAAKADGGEPPFDPTHASREEMMRRVADTLNRAGMIPTCWIRQIGSQLGSARGSDHLESPSAAQTVAPVQHTAIRRVGTARRTADSDATQAVWTVDREWAALLTGDSKRDEREIAAACGLSRAELQKLQQQGWFQARVREHQRLLPSLQPHNSLANPAVRVAKLKVLRRGLQQISDAHTVYRAAEQAITSRLIRSVTTDALMGVASSELESDLLRLVRRIERQLEQERTTWSAAEEEVERRRALREELPQQRRPTLHQQAERLLKLLHQDCECMDSDLMRTSQSDDALEHP
jgi:hypothetical protein